VQLYEIDDELVISVIKAMASNFSDLALYAANDEDMILVAFKSGAASDPDPQVLQNPALSRTLRRIHVVGAQDIAIRRIGNKRFLKKLLQASSTRENSDYEPVLDQNAARTRFLRTDAKGFLQISHDILPVFDLLAGSALPDDHTNVDPSPGYEKAKSAFAAMALRDFFLQGAIRPGQTGVDKTLKQQAMQVRDLFAGTGPVSVKNAILKDLYETGAKMTAYLSPGEMAAVWKKLEAGPGSARMSSEEKDLIALFKAVGMRDAAEMTRAARLVLERRGLEFPQRTRYALAAGMTGLLMQHDRQGAGMLWSRYGPGLFPAGRPDLLFRLLVAESTIPD